MAHTVGAHLWAHVALVMVLLLCWRDTWTNALDMIDMDSPELTCSEGLRDCQVSSESPFEVVLPDPEGPVSVTDMALTVALCCTDGDHCVPCLQIIMTIQVLDGFEESGDSTEETDLINHTTVGSGLYMFQKALVKVCISSPGSGDHCKTLKFSYSSYSTHEIRLRERVMFGSPVLVRVLVHSREYHQNITMPSLEKVCFLKPESLVIQDCDAPSIKVEADHKSDVVRLKLENRSMSDEILMCQIIWDEAPGQMLTLRPQDGKEIVISMNSAAPCLCFQVWWKNKTVRREYCPFKNQQVVLERMLHNVSLDLVESQVRGGGTVLVWNLTAPCRIKAQVWLCKRDEVSGECLEVTGSRQTLDRAAGWVTNQQRSWKTGEFSSSQHPLLCLQFKLDGMKSQMDPYCPLMDYLKSKFFSVSRWRWILLVLVALLLVCASILGACVLQRVLKGYAWRWLKDDDVKGAVGGGHVVLLYPPDDEQALPGLMCHLGSSLQALGCSVSLDLWSHAELSVLGPVPWLHSRLDQMQRQGGKVVLVLTQAARRKAEEWGARGWDKLTPSQRGKDVDSGTNSTCVDVFSASLSCILADYLQGRAGERFMLVQFESLPPEPQGVCQPLPELFRGLHVYSLPSQSLGFLTELAGARQIAASSSRQKRARRLRMASRALARGLSGFTAGTAVLRLAAMPQSCVGTGEEEDAAETMPLQPYLITPPSSPDSNLKHCEMEWV